MSYPKTILPPEETTQSPRSLTKSPFNNAGPSSSLQKQSLRQGDIAALNTYTVDLNSAADQGLLGYAKFPSSYSSNPDDDGVVMRFMTLPGGGQTNYNGGHVLTHETGHWGCTGSGDMVDDTPAQAEPASGCPEGRDTCSSPGVDPPQREITLMIHQIATYRGL
ncbi:hypothetical protein ACEPAF_4320 [Sanghuangporus sanghuang]